MSGVVNNKKLISETGNRYGKLVVLERVGTKVFPSGQSKPIWLCQCDCGNTTETYAQSLRAGTVQSCGCKRLEIDKDWTGVTQGSLTVVGRAADGLTKSGVKTIRWECLCACGAAKVIKSSGLKKGASSCGCQYSRETHGHTTNADHSPTFTSWHAMMQRCLNENHQSYQTYGAIGITVCEAWKDFTKFLLDMGSRPEGTSLNRVKGANIYSLETCEWATYSVQAYDQKKRVTNKSGVIGVCWDKAQGKWEAYISVDKKKISLGFHENLEDAAHARKVAELKYYGFTKQ